MNKKKINYILLPLVLFIWGGVIYTLVDGLSSSSDEYPVNKPLPQVKMEDIENDTFVLLANYRDPFLKKKFQQFTSVENNSPINTSKNKIKPPITEAVKPAIDWSFIQYHGRIKNQKTGRNVGMLSINGQSHLINEGEKVQQVKLITLSEDSVKVSYQDKYATITKN